VAAPTSNEQRDQSVGELVRELAHETTTLVRQEVDLARAEASRAAETVVMLARQELELAKAEMAQKARTAVPGFGLISVAAGAALLAGGALAAFLILLLDEVMPDWLAAFIVGLALAGTALALYFAGRNRVREAAPFIPEQTIETVKEDVEWAKTQAGSEQR
jgi:VIT1/CCC1 family predicted Fe2+/Mn2+ transporter